MSKFQSTNVTLIYLPLSEKQKAQIGKLISFYDVTECHAGTLETPRYAFSAQAMRGQAYRTAKVEIADRIYDAVAKYLFERKLTLDQLLNSK